MKPKNFPERRGQRQLRALSRLRQKPVKTEEDLREITVLEQRTSQSLRGVRTKKHGTAAERIAARKMRRGEKANAD